MSRFQLSTVARRSVAQRDEAPHSATLLMTAPLMTAPLMTVVLMTAVLMTSAGCPKLSGERANAPLPDPDETAAAAMAKYDGNGDGSLSADEIAGSPGLVVAKTRIDVDGDGQLNEQEIVDYFDLYIEAGVTLKTVEVTATLDGRPLVGATVTLIPDDIHSDATKQATAVTGSGGRCQLVSEGATYPAVQMGLYRVTVSLDDGGGEQIPAKYNTESDIGIEVSAPAASEIKHGVQLELYSR